MPVSQDLYLERVVGIFFHDTGHLRPGMDRLAVDVDHMVPGLKPGFCCRRTLHD